MNNATIGKTCRQIKIVIIVHFAMYLNSIWLLGMQQIDLFTNAVIVCGKQ
jgi:hypothetical protein